MDATAFPLSTTIYNELNTTHEIALYFYLGAMSRVYTDGAYRCEVSMDQMCAALHLPRWRTKRVLNGLTKANVVIAKEQRLPYLLPMIRYTYRVVVL
jgi:transcription initiation factor IIE alpha subunit